MIFLHLEMNHYSAEAKDDFEIKTARTKKPLECVLSFVDTNFSRY